MKKKLFYFVLCPANSGTVTSPQTPQYPRILYQHFTDDRILQQTHLACQLLGYYGMKTSILSFF